MVFHLYWLTQIMWQTCPGVCLNWIILLPRSSLEGKDWQVKRRILTSGTDETMNFSTSPIKMCPLTLLPLFLNPVKALVCMLALHLEVQWACRKELDIHSGNVHGVHYLAAWCGGCPHFCSHIRCKMNLLLRRDEIIQSSYAKVCVRFGETGCQSAFWWNWSLGKVGPAWEPRWCLGLGSYPVVQPMLPVFSSYLDLFKILRVIEDSRSLELLGVVASPSSINFSLSTSEVMVYLARDHMLFLPFSPSPSV